MKTKKMYHRICLHLANCVFSLRKIIVELIDFLLLRLVVSCDWSFISRRAVVSLYVVSHEIDQELSLPSG